MTKTATWLLGGAALTLFASAGLAIAAEPAAKDAKAAAERRVERDVRIYRFGGPEGRGPGDRMVMVHRGGPERAEHLRDILQLRPEQEPALKAFTEATTRKGPRHEMVRFDRDEGKTTPERLAEMERRLAEQQAEARARIDATRTFYNQLDARQKKAFDAMPMLMMAGPNVGPMMIPIHHRMPGPPVPPPPPAPPQPL